MGLIEDICKKKELASLDPSFVEQSIEKYFQTNSNMKKYLSYNPRSDKYKRIVKEIRAILRRSYGLFRGDSSGLLELVKKVKKDKTTIKEILSLHASTKERLPFYDKLYKKIFKVTGEPSSLLDVGCGLNPFSIIYMKSPPVYHAYDLSKDEVQAINSFFTILKIKGKAVVKDVTKTSFPTVDLALLFKMTDVIDGKGHKNTEKLLTSIPAKHLVVSFPTVTISNKRMRFPRRKWIELLCERLGWTQVSFEMGNELFYVITTS